LGASNKKLRAARAAIRALYASLPSVPCKGLCQASCGPIDACVGPVEREMAGGLDLAVMEWPPAACPMLTEDGKCSKYENRPYICRAWGAIDHPDMTCPWGCRPSRMLTEKEGLDHLRKLMEIEARYAGETNLLDGDDESRV